MGLYDKKGGYSGYDKKNKEREALDFYSTPTEEVENILNVLNIDFSNQTILEPCCGGGHMVNGILMYIVKHQCTYGILKATDIQTRHNVTGWKLETGKEYDFLSDDYPYTENIDYIIMNPPYSVIEPFAAKSLAIANKGVLMLGRLQFLESEKRYEIILKDYPPNDFWVYVDRIACYKNGNINEKMSSAQAYAWFYWDCTKPSTESHCHWIRRVNKKG